MLDDAVKAQLIPHLSRITRPIEMHASIDESSSSQEMLALLRALSELTPQIRLHEHHDDDQRHPSFALTTPGHQISLRFAGLPMGHEFTSLILALLHVGGHPPKITPDLQKIIQSLPGQYRFETYFSQSCQNCPDVVQALNLAAVLNPNISHTAIDGAVFPREVQDRQILSVPAIYLNGQPFGQGRMSLEEMIHQLDQRVGQRQVEAISAKPPFDVLIVGGGPAGAAAAIYAARKGVRTGIVTHRFGGQVLDTAAIENLIAVPETQGPELAQGLEAQVRHHGVDVLTMQEAQALRPAGTDGLITVQLKSGAQLRSRTVIAATGAQWRQMQVPGEDEYRNRGVAYCPHCDGPLFKGKTVAVVGGGNSGVEAAIDLAGIAQQVILLEFDRTLRADEVLQNTLRSLTNVRVLLSAQTTEVHGDGQKVTGLTYRDRVSQGQHHVTLDGIFVQIGLLPVTHWMEHTVALNTRREIVVDAKGQTNILGVFAAGDATSVPYKQIVIAMGEGAKASLSAFDYLIRTQPND